VALAQKRFVYVLRSSVDPARHYVGLTSDVTSRLAAHNAGQAVHTATKKPWTLVVSIEFRDERVARRFEHYLKSGSGRAFAKRHFADVL
jgi:predicted GIY-YIG superfamily endonuclease